MLTITLNRLKPQAHGKRSSMKNRQASEQEGSSTYDSSVINIYHVFIDFKKAFDRVWHAASWATMKKYNISTNLIKVIKNLYDKATSSVLFHSSIGDWFQPTVGVRRDVYSHPPSSTYFWKGS